MNKLTLIQSELKVPKNLKNTFGNYNYRNLEGIMEGVKPLLGKYNCSLILADEIVLIGDRYYLKAIATLTDNETKETISVSAYAREPLEKKGMDTAQITGATSSYARKYACNGLFAIDDTQDPDTDAYSKLSDDKTTKPSVAKAMESVKKLQDTVANNPLVSDKVKEIVKPTVKNSTTDGNIDGFVSGLILDLELKEGGYSVTDVKQLGIKIREQYNLGLDSAEYIRIKDKFLTPLISGLQK